MRFPQKKSEIKIEFLIFTYILTLGQRKHILFPYYIFRIRYKTFLFLFPYSAYFSLDFIVFILITPIILYKSNIIRNFSEQILK